MNQRGLPYKPSDPVNGAVPPSREVDKFHTNSDVDGSDGSKHHTLGPRKGQAAPGDHDHRGGNSVLLLDGEIISGSKASGDALDSIIALLVNLGASDQTLP